MSQSDEYTYVLNVDPRRMCLAAVADRAKTAIGKAEENCKREDCGVLLRLCADLLHLVFKYDIMGSGQNDDIFAAEAINHMRQSLVEIESLYPEAKEFLDIVIKKHGDGEA
jgi:hypothetical protein